MPTECDEKNLKKNESENRKILFKHLPLLLRYAPMQCTLSAIAFIYVHRNPMRTVCLCLFCCGSCLRTATRVKTVMPSNEPTVHSKVEEKNAFETSNKIYCSSLAAIASHQQHWNAREKNTKRTSHTLQNETTNKRIKLLPNFTHTHTHTPAHKQLICMHGPCGSYLWRTATDKPVNRTLRERLNTMQPPNPTTITKTAK